MFFAKDDIIELKEKNYLVKRVALIENEAYYEVVETDKETDEELNDQMIIKAINEDATLYIEETNDEDLIKEINKELK